MAEHTEGARFSRIGQVAAAVGLIALAIASFLSGTDRVSRDFPNSPGVVGWPYDTGAARTRAILALVQKGPASSLGYARRAILSDPISAQAVSVLGRAQLYAGQSAEAHKTFEVSGQMGWRDGMTQIYWLDQAMQAGDLKVAAERLDALLRQAPNDENRDRFLAVVSASPEGRAAIAERLKLSPAWAEPYATSLNDLPLEQVVQRVDVIRHTGRGVWSCPATEAITQKLIEAEMLDVAQSVWRQNCATSSSLVYDGSFDQLDTTKASSGFAWQLTNSGDIDVQLASTSDGGHKLDIDVAATRTMPILSQLIVLRPGNYRLTWRMPDTPQINSRALKVSLGCKRNLADAVVGEPDSKVKETYSLTFTVDDACTARQLIFWLAPNSPIHMDDIALQPI